MRVLFWCGSFWPRIGGVEVRAAKLLPALRDKGHKFTVVTSQLYSDLPTQDSFQGIPVHRFRFNDIGTNVDKLVEIRNQIAKLRREFMPDLIHRNGVTGDGFFCLKTVNRHSVPTLVTLINDLQTQRLSRDTLLGHLLFTADWVSTVSSAALRQVRELIPEITPRSSVIQNGINTVSLVAQPISTHPPRLLCLGRLARQKGIDIVLEALPSVLTRFPQTRLLIAGDGPEREALQQQTTRLGLSQVVDFLGWIAPQDVPRLLNSATMLILPSRWEGLPNVALQAGLMARPVIGSRVGGLPEIIEDQKTGLLVEPEDSNAIAQAVTSLLNCPGRLVQMGKAARQRVQQCFSWERYVDSYDTLYRRLAHARNYS